MVRKLFCIQITAKWNNKVWMIQFYSILGK